MLSAILVDDERPALTWLGKLIADHTEIEVKQSFMKASEALAAAAALQPDVVFLDIEMPGISGMELAGLLAERVPHAEIVFVTAYSEYALEAFRIHAIDYLLKPVTPEDIIRCVSGLSKRIRRAEPLRRKQGSRLLCLGSFQVYGAASEEPVRFPTAKVEELLGFLMMHENTDVSKWTICERLWPGFEPEKAEQNLHTTVYRLKKTLAEQGVEFQLESQRGSYRLTGDAYCDRRAFEQLRKAGGGDALRLTLGELEEAGELYRGPLFEGKDYSWCEADRERLQRQFSVMVKQAALRRMEAGEMRQAVDLLHGLVAKLPYDEEAHETLLHALARQHDRLSFIAQYIKYKEMLEQELGLAPRPDMEALFAQVAASGEG